MCILTNLRLFGRRKPPSVRLRSASPHAAMMYIDGACSNNGNEELAIGGIGVFWPNRHEWNISEPFSGRQSANRAEIFAACRGIEKAISLSFSEAYLFSDSRYLIKGAIARNYSQRLKGRERDTEEFERLWTLMDRIDTHFTWIKSESNPADQLAKQAVEAKREEINRYEPSSREST